MRKKIILFVILLVGTGLGVSMYVSANCLTVSEYSVTEEVDETVRIVHLTDLHNKEFGKNNTKLIEKVKGLGPDLIFITGDMFNQDEEPDSICELISKLVYIAPVYYGYGNAEMDWENGTAEELKTTLESAGAIVLNCEYEDIEVNGQKFRIGGYYGYYRTPHMRMQDEAEQAAEIAFAEEFENTDRIKVLLAHIPTTWLDWEYRDEFPVNLIFCGHYHGGQIRIPFVGGLYVPYVGWFPKYTKGIFEGEQGTCILSAGLGSELYIPRVNNLPEIVVVDVKPGKY